jgi:hypothetical protein
MFCSKNCLGAFNELYGEVQRKILFFYGVEKLNLSADLPRNEKVLPGGGLKRSFHCICFWPVRSQSKTEKWPVGRLSVHSGSRLSKKKDFSLTHPSSTVCIEFSPASTNMASST